MMISAGRWSGPGMTGVIDPEGGDRVRGVGSLNVVFIVITLTIVKNINNKSY